LTLARAIKWDTALAGTRLIVLTSFGHPFSRAEMKEAGIDAYLVKPIKQSCLFDCVASAMSKAVAENVATTTHTLSSPLLYLIVRFGLENNTAGKSVVTLAAEQDERVVVAVHRPRARRHLAEFGESPVACIFVPKAEEVADGRRHVQTGALIQIRSWTFVAKHILPVIGAERAAIFPLSVTDSVPVTDR